MRILGMKPDHDGSIAFARGNDLVFSLEGEKGSFERYRDLSALTLADAALLADEPPDVLAVGGWDKHLPGHYGKAAAGYFGLDAVEVSEAKFFGRPVTFFSSSHERSHIFMSAALSPEAPIEECVILVWEGVLGAFYHWRKHGKKIIKRHVLTEPGARYAALFGLADPTFLDRRDPRFEDAGKLMALAAYGDAAKVSRPAAATIEALLTCRTVYPFDKKNFADSPLHDCGLDDPTLHNAAQYLSDRLFDIFHRVAEAEFSQGLPLLVSGGCGLNCEWNKRWVDSGLFSSVFVPPCTNDSGSAIGTVADAMSHLGNPCKLDWSVYAGTPFRHDSIPDPTRWAAQPVDLTAVARLLAHNEVLAWVQGRYEIGPRALGHRSLLASPLAARSRTTLNTIKEREPYRPIAPCCLSDELDKWFDDAIADPYMLYFSRVTTDALPAITHVDQTARVQTVFPDDESSLAPLLSAFRKQTGYGVLCNTSLNFKGHGFINDMSDLLAYCELKKINNAVLDDTWYTRVSYK
ncbi:carbamoyltransferase C-terminal domain-containing protein [Actinocrispum wychmicini]|uniref:Hydroxymethyl cephem carbamoyltransferase n=1 Tax=Actinocrispum wychmicini TaxID=1213861 RepID=A0A4R2JM54_9PSEU|nr:carbamoyltransferase C-terminal domain-containing protein [Actinocrispum wychmicini]TCO61151.1 hydroxymethyl cephem carbamoyltransferase [Actinocrispum wychmicini]